MSLPTDSHVHTQWSWDAVNGSMELSCRQAVDLGLPAIAFTEHLDHTVWSPVDLTPTDHMVTLLSSDGSFTPPAFDTSGYLESIERCRDMFPSLRILSGLELGEPHWHADSCARILGAGTFDRVLGSLHCLNVGDDCFEPPGLFKHLPAEEVVRRYLAEVATLIEGSYAFSVLAHIDYPVRHWPSSPFDPLVFEDEFRHTLRVLAESGRALEINTRLPLHATILGWWCEEGGTAVSFGSDAHEPLAIARGFGDAVAMAEAYGFRPGPSPVDCWVR
jgi:histidinol-phosphatase (PHP family)